MITLGRLFEPEVAEAVPTMRGKDVHVDVDRLAATRLLLCATSGGGKSWTLRRLLEQTYGLLPHHIIDPEGEFYTLRDAGFDYVVAGKGHDCPTDPQHAAALARKMLELGASIVLDLSELDPAHRSLFVRNYLAGLIDSPRALWPKAALVVVDEADTFCPERGEGEATSRESVIALMARGRKRGLCGVLATQRLAKLDKSAAAEAVNVMVGRTSVIDLARAQKVLGCNKDVRDSLKHLAPGTFHVFGPAIDLAGVVKVGPVTSRHPQAGGLAQPTAPAPATLKKILAALADLPSVAAEEARTMEDLRARVRELERQVMALPQRQIEGAVAHALALERGKWIERMQGFARGLEQRVCDSVHDTFAAVDILGAFPASLTPAAVAAMPDYAAAPVAPPPDPTIERAARSYAMEIDDEDRRKSGATGPEQKLLDSLAWFEAIGVDTPTAAAIAFLAGYSPNTSSYKNARGSCRTKGWITYEGGGSTALTAAGRAIAAPPQVPQTDAGLQQVILDKLAGPERKILTALLPHGSEGLTNNALAAATGYSTNTSSFKNARGHLRSLGFIVYDRGHVAASATMYPEG